MRAFLAIDLPAPIVEAIGQLVDAVPVGRPVPPDNLHLTLAFLDEQDEVILSELHSELETLHPEPFDLELSGLGCFGGRSPKVLYVRAVADPALFDLHRRVIGAARRVGIVLPRERFRPHVTLARFGRGLDPVGASRLQDFIAARAGFSVPPVPVAAFSLFRSTLRHDGAVHEELARYDLVAGGIR